MMKTRGQLSEMLLEIDPENRKDFVIGEGRDKVLHERVLKALCVILMASILHHNEFENHIEAVGCQINPCDICAASEIIKRNQCALTWHTDDVKLSHVDSEDIDKFC